jgi:hypothetical protein
MKLGFEIEIFIWQSPLNFNMKLQIPIRVCKRSYVEYVDSENNSNPLVHACNLSKKEKKSMLKSSITGDHQLNIGFPFQENRIINLTIILHLLLKA